MLKLKRKTKNAPHFWDASLDSYSTMWLRVAKVPETHLLSNLREVVVSVDGLPSHNRNAAKDG